MGLVVAVLVGAGLVLVSAAHYAPKWDGVAYLDLARSIASGRGMSDANGTVDHHAAPLWPAFIAAVGGDAAVAGVLAVAFLWGVTYFGAAVLWNARVGLRALALTATTSGFLSVVRLGYSEALVAALYVALVFLSVASLRKPAALPACGVVTGLLYLAKASLGYSLVVGALAGAAWRLRAGSGAFLRRDYALAAALAAVVGGAWIARNVAHFGVLGWETQPYATLALRQLLYDPTALPRLGVAFALTLTALLRATGPGLLALNANRPDLPRGQASGLLLGGLAPALAAVPLVAAFWLTEAQPLASVADDAARYALVGLPALWALFAHDRRATWFTLVLNGASLALTRLT